VEVVLVELEKIAHSVQQVVVDMVVLAFKFLLQELQQTHNLLELLDLAVELVGMLVAAVVEHLIQRLVDQEVVPEVLMLVPV
jgi:hypothetical protein